MEYETFFQNDLRLLPRFKYRRLRLRLRFFAFLFHACFFTLALPASSSAQECSAPVIHHNNIRSVVSYSESGKWFARSQRIPGTLVTLETSGTYVTQANQPPYVTDLVTMNSLADPIALLQYAFPSTSDKSGFEIWNAVISISQRSVLGIYPYQIDCNRVQWDFSNPGYINFPEYGDMIKVATDPEVIAISYCERTQEYGVSRSLQAKAISDARSSCAIKSGAIGHACCKVRSIAQSTARCISFSVDQNGKPWFSHGPSEEQVERQALYECRNDPSSTGACRLFQDSASCF